MAQRVAKLGEWQGYASGQEIGEGYGEQDNEKERPHHGQERLEHRAPHGSNVGKEGHIGIGHFGTRAVVDGNID